jgi:nucleotide-binding universal stress UspA family protein
MAFKHVLVPTDLSEPGNHAVRYAVEEAALHHAKVTLLHVLPPTTRTDVYYVTGAGRWWDLGVPASVQLTVAAM